MSEPMSIKQAYESYKHLDTAIERYLVYGDDRHSLLAMVHILWESIKAAAEAEQPQGAAMTHEARDRLLALVVDRCKAQEARRQEIRRRHWYPDEYEPGELSVAIEGACHKQ